MQTIPLNVYRTPDRLSVAAPLPGVLPEDITIDVTPEGVLRIDGALRGVPADVQVFHHPAPTRRPSAAPTLVEEVRELILEEWVIGSYYRELELPAPINARLATATYGNGVLVVALPTARKLVPASIGLEPVGAARGERVGSAGHPVKRASTRRHVSAVHPPQT